MNIERINDNKLRVDLDKADLDSRQIKLSELAYGSDKAKVLFEELIHQAGYDYGFDVGEGPYMIEAVPTSSESITLFVTKMDAFDELDTRFSRFSPANPEQEEFEYEEEEAPFRGLLPDFSDSSATDVLNMFKKILNRSGKEEHAAENDVMKTINITKLYVFRSLEELILAAKAVRDVFEGTANLYRNPKDDRYYLIISKGDTEPDDFNRVCNILAEYGSQNNYAVGTDDYMTEHYKLITKDNAISILGKL